MGFRAPSRLRPPAAADQFYDADRARCAQDAERLCQPYEDTNLPARLLGALVPHAGWIFSGRIAGGTLATLARRSDARTFLLTGSVHTMDLPHPATDDADAWATPLGEVPVDRELRAAVNTLDGFAPRAAAHRREHSLEVLLPLMQTVFPTDFTIVPCLIPVRKAAVAWGRSLGNLLRDWPHPVAVIASSDLTHYGPNFGFHPEGIGEEGHRWAGEVNDRELLDRIETMDPQRALEHAARQRSACGGGAIAATIAACQTLGATRGYVLDHTDSMQEGAAIGHRDKVNAVGYAGVVFA